MVGGPVETQGKLSHQLRCGQRATQVPGSTRVAEPKDEGWHSKCCEWQDKGHKTTSGHQIY